MRFASLLGTPYVAGIMGLWLVPPLGETFQHKQGYRTTTSIFINLDKVYSYKTRLSAKQSYYLPKVSKNYGKFNIRFQGPTIWNTIDQDIKVSSSHHLNKI